MYFKFKIICAAIFVATLSATSITPNIQAAALTNSDLLKLIEQQQAQIEELKALIIKTNSKVEITETKVESAIDVIEDNLSTASTSNTQVGGYGELHYNNTDDGNQIDFHRFVMFFSHQFSDSVRFFSELEVEHALSGDGKPGEVELEQAYIETDLTASTTLKAGIFIIPVGIINETHEPPTFYGVERNPVEKNIIPATWWEGGVAFNTQFSDGWNADFAIHSGLSVPTSGSKSFLIRSGRQKVAKADANNLAYTARIKYTAIPGLELAASVQIQDDITQGELGLGATLLTAHAVYNKNNFGLKALYATWDIDDNDIFNQVEQSGRNQQSGYYLEPSYRINQQWGIFARYNVWDNNAGNSIDSEKKQTNLGVNYWLHENVVIKFDWENQSGISDGDAFNLGIGYQF